MQPIAFYMRQIFGISARISLIFLIGYLSTSCTSITKKDLASSEDYGPSMKAIKYDSPQEAVESFHKKEPDGFITTFEKQWLRTLAGDPDLEALRAATNELEERQFHSISQSAKAFFYKETEDGYYPAEHEAILLHLVTAMAFAKNGLREQALVETRRAAFYLEAEYAPDRDVFDDPGLRLWLAALWIYGGQWEHAKVDLRVAGKALKSKRLLKLAKQEFPPKEFNVMLIGPGPEVKWDEDKLAKIKFTPGTGSPKKMTLAERPPAIDVVGTSEWYDRHQERNRAIQDLLEGSQYMVSSSGYATAAGAVYTTGTVFAGVFLAAGLGVSLALVGGGLYLAVITEVGEFTWVGIGAGLYTAGWTINTSSKLMNETKKTAEDTIREGFDRSDYYRFVRFLPDYIVADWSERKSIKPTLKIDSQDEIGPFWEVATPEQGGVVRFFHGAQSGYETVDSGASLWVDSDTNYIWHLVDHEKSGAQATTACLKARGAHKEKFRLPSSKEIAEAIRHKMFDAGTNISFGNTPISAKFWTGTDDNNEGIGCEWFERLTRSTAQSLNCGQYANVLCVATP